MAGGQLDGAKNAKADEFYTQLSDIEKELKNYKEYFKNKTVFCNCDDPEESNFYYYFVSHFDELGLTKLITTHFEYDKQSYSLEYSGGADVRGSKDEVIKRANLLAKKTLLKQNYEQGDQGDLFVCEPTKSYSGDFRSPESISLLRQSDIIVTNPPFSLFREYVAQLVEHNKLFLILGSQNALTYKEIFRLIKENKIWTGIDNGGTKWFEVPDDYNIKTETRIKTENGKKYFSMGSVFWFTNMVNKKRNEEIILYKKYYGNELEYPKFDNYDAINIDKVSDIPMDFNGVMGVPITFIDKYNPNQFEIIDGLNRYSVLDIAGTNEQARDKHLHMTEINGIAKYFRILIKNKKIVQS